MPRKRAAGQSKAQMIRDYIKSHPKVRNVDIVAALADQGVKVTPNYVSITKSKGRGKRGRRGRRGRRGAAARAMSRSTNGVGLDQMRDAARLIRSAGGIDGARQALALAEEIAKVLA